MIEINLLPQELRKKEVTRLAIPNIFNRQFIVTAIAMFLAAHGLLGAAVIYQNVQWGSARHRIVFLKKSVEETSRRKLEVKAAQERIDQIEQATQRKFSWARLLNALSDSVPKGLWLRSFVVTEETQTTAAPKAEKSAHKKAPAAVSPAEQKLKALKLEGSVVGNGQETATISRFIKALKEDAYFNSVFSEVEFFNITQRKIKSFDVYDFVIICLFKKGKF